MRYICTVCGYVYDEAKEQVPFESLPDIWKCPICRAPKSAFEPEEEPVPAETSPAIAESAAENSAAEEVAVEPVADEWISKIGESDLKKLSPGQLSALCSNLARGCEKQYKPEESKLFKQLSDYFASVTPAVNDASVEGIAAMLQGDIANYKGVRATADAAEDRGAARVCVWGEKVTRMLSSLVGRYIDEGEAMLADTGVWVCTVCGFVYIGDEAPELCPVCKVPSWKFEEIQGR